MLDEQKVRLMARTALYEQSLGSRTIKLNNRFEKGASKATFFDNVPAGIITFILAAAFAAAFIPDEVRMLYYRLGLGLSLIIAAAACLVFVFFYSLYARHMFRKAYDGQKGVFWKYNFTREKLRRLGGKKTKTADGTEAVK